jgi:uncharacterized protein
MRVIMGESSRRAKSGDSAVRRAPDRPWPALPRAILVLAFLVLGLTAALDAADAPKVVISASDGTRKAAVGVELAVTPGQRQFGLMYRQHLDADAGMLFIFPAPDRLKFWMKHTEIPLDMIFADPAGAVVGIVANATPYSERPVGPDALALYVLEVNGGFCARHGVRTGDRMSFIGFDPHTSQ